MGSIFCTAQSAFSRATEQFIRIEYIVLSVSKYPENRAKPNFSLLHGFYFAGNMDDSDLIVPVGALNP